MAYRLRSGRRLGSKEGRSINVASLIDELKVLAGLLQQFGAPLTGVIIGSCELGRNGIDWTDAMQGTSLRWIVGYRYSVGRFAFMHVDLPLLLSALQRGAFLQLIESGKC